LMQREGRLKCKLLGYSHSCWSGHEQ
jgi:hypothetical protein